MGDPPVARRAALRDRSAAVRYEYTPPVRKESDIATLIELMWPEASPVIGLPAPEWDPLVREGGLRDAELLDVRVDPGWAVSRILDRSSVDHAATVAAVR
jgi:hypothetical protein